MTLADQKRMIMGAILTGQFKGIDDTRRRRYFVGDIEVTPVAEEMRAKGWINFWPYAEWRVTPRGLKHL